MEYANINDMVGQTFVAIDGKKGSDTLDFIRADGSIYRFYHEQDCCEDVRIEDIYGDLNDLINSPLLAAEEINNFDDPGQLDEYDDHYTWTFYKFSTIKGSVTIRWYGTSNGYYSEDVELDYIPAGLSS